MARRLVAFVSMGAAVAGAALLPVTGGGIARVMAETIDQGSAEPVLSVPAPRPATSSALGLFGDIQIAGAFGSLGSQTVTTLEVGNGDTLIAMLVDAGSAEPDADRAIEAMEDFFNPRRLQVGQVITAVFGPAGSGGSSELTAVSLTLGEADYVVASRTTDGEFVARRSDQPLDAALVAPVQAAPAALAGDIVVRDVEVRRGDTLMRLAVRAGADRASADAAIAALGRLYDPQGLQIGQKLQILFAPSGTELLGLGVEIEPGKYVVVERSAEGTYAARRSDAPAAASTVAAAPGAGAADLAPLFASLDERGGRVERLTISSGDTLMDLIVEAGATLTEAHEAARTLGRHFDPRRLQIGQSVYVVRMPGPRGSGLEVLGLVLLDAGEDGLVAVVRDSESGGFIGQRIADAAQLAALSPAAVEAVEAAEAAETLSEPDVLAPDFDSATRVELLTARSGDTLISILTRAGASRSEADRAVSALRPHYDPRRLQIEQEVRVAFEDVADRSVMISVSVKLKDGLYVQADLQGSTWVAQRTTTPVNPAFARSVAMAMPELTEEIEAEATDAGAEAVPDVSESGPQLNDLPLPISAFEAEQGLSPQAEQVWFEIADGDTIESLLLGLTSNRREIERIVDTLEVEYDIRRLQLGQQMVAIVDEDGAGTHVVAMSLAVDDDETVVVVRQRDGHYAARRASSHVDLADFVLNVDEEEPAMPDLLAVWPEPAETLALASVEIPSGGTLMGALIDLGIDGSQATDAVDSMKDIFNPRSIRAGQVIEIAHLGAELQGIVFVPTPGERVEVARADDGYVSRTVVLPLERNVVAVRGTIRSSLYQAAEDAGVPLPVLADLIRAYSFDVDFQREIRTGDSFDVLYEVFADEDGNVVRYGAPLYAMLNVSGVTLPIYQYTPGSGFTDFFNDKGESVRKALLRTPVDGAKITSGFGMRDHPLLGYSRMHKGVDFGAPSGTPILAAGDGIIEFLGTNSGYGKYIRIRHNSTYKTAYAHMSSYGADLNEGSRVRQGQVIGYVGQTGLATGPHLHYEVMVNDEQINPLDIKLPSGEVLAGAELESFYAVRDGLDAQYAEALSSQYVAARP